MLNECTKGLPWLFCIILVNMHPWAAIGAAFGCCFFLTKPPTETKWYDVGLLCLFSWGMGYGAGVFFYGDGPPYSVKAMAVASLVSAFAAVIAASVWYMVENRGDLPAWAQNVLDRLPALRKRGTGDGD